MSFWKRKDLDKKEADKQEVKVNSQLLGNVVKGVETRTITDTPSVVALKSETIKSETIKSELLNQLLKNGSAAHNTQSASVATTANTSVPNEIMSAANATTTQPAAISSVASSIINPANAIKSALKQTALNARSAQHSIRSNLVNSSPANLSSVDQIAERFGNIRSVLGPKTRIDGKICFDSSIRIDGIFNGEVLSSKLLLVGAGGKITGDIETETLVVAGDVRADIRAFQKVIVLNGGILEGNIYSPSLVIEEGGTFNGSSFNPAFDQIRDAKNGTLAAVSNVEQVSSSVVDGSSSVAPSVVKNDLDADLSIANSEMLQVATISVDDISSAVTPAITAMH